MGTVAAGAGTAAAVRRRPDRTTVRRRRERLYRGDGDDMDLRTPPSDPRAWRAARHVPPTAPSPAPSARTACLTSPTSPGVPLARVEDGRRRSSTAAGGADLVERAQVLRVVGGADDPHDRLVGRA